MAVPARPDPAGTGSLDLLATPPEALADAGSARDRALAATFAAHADGRGSLLVPATGVAPGPALRLEAQAGGSAAPRPALDSNQGPRSGTDAPAPSPARIDGPAASLSGAAPNGRAASGDGSPPVLLPGLALRVMASGTAGPPRDGTGPRPASSPGALPASPAPQRSADAAPARAADHRDREASSRGGRSNSPPAERPAAAPAAASGAAVAPAGSEPASATPRMPSTADGGAPAPAGPGAAEPDPALVTARPAADQITLRFEGEDGLEGRLRVALRGQTVRATIVTGDHDTAQRLGTEIHDLQRALADRGFAAARLSVHESPAAPTAGALARDGHDPRGERNPHHPRPDRERRESPTDDSGRGSQRHPSER